MNDAEKFQEQLYEIARRDRYCSGCGRELVDVTRPDWGFDRRTGQRPMILWRDCPQGRKWWVRWFMVGRHDSFQIGRAL